MDSVKDLETSLRQMEAERDYNQRMQKFFDEEGYEGAAKSYERKAFWYEVACNAIKDKIKAELPNDPYAQCESLEECFQVFMEIDPQMRKFFGRDKDGK